MSTAMQQLSLAATFDTESQRHHSWSKTITSSRPWLLVHCEEICGRTTFGASVINCQSTSVVACRGPLDVCIGPSEYGHRFGVERKTRLGQHFRHNAALVAAGVAAAAKGGFWAPFSGGGFWSCGSGPPLWPCCPFFAPCP